MPAKKTGLGKGLEALFSENQLTKEEERVLQVITAEPITIEEIAYLSKLSIAELMPILSMLELYDCIQQMIGRKYIRVG